MQKASAIALVDDSDLIRLSMSMILEDAGFVVHSFACPTEFLRSDILGHVDCILTDLDMPIMNGCELQLHMKGLRPRLPIVFMTGSTDERPRKDALRRGAFAYLSKPTRATEIIGILSAAIASYGTLCGVFPTGLAVA